MIIRDKTLDRLFWAWFNRKSGLSMRVFKLGPDRSDKGPWLLIRGQKERQGYRETNFKTLGDLLAGLFEPEMDSLIEKLDISPMLLLAMAADDGDVT